VSSWLEKPPTLLLAAALLALAAALAFSALDRDQPAGIVLYEEAASDGPLRVHVAGAVAEPGVYELGQGARVEQALAAAGGATADADLDALNLARRLRDGEQVLVPGGGRAAAAAPAAALAPGEKLDINTATQAQLDQLPGIGEAYSRRIVDSRQVDGPFETTDELVSRKVVPAATYEKIRDLITVSAP
jgi:competence protein ComEA